MSLSLFPVFVVGLLGSVHCAGMCGGIVGAFSAVPARRRFPVAVASLGAPVALEAALRVMAYNAGRIASYTAAGALAGGLAGGMRTMAGALPLQVAGYWLANGMLVALGLYLMDAWRGLARVEAAGRWAWRRIEPLTRRLMPLDSPLKLFGLGALWGWLPCGMVYSVLLTSMLSGSAASGAGVMLAFGLGTLPMLLAMGVLGARLRGWLQRRPVRLASGGIVLGFGVLGLLRAAAGVGGGWFAPWCLAP